MPVVLIVGIASTAAGALYLYRKVMGGSFGEPDTIIKIIRQTTGVVLAVTNFIRSALNALQLLQPAAEAAGGNPLRMLRSNRVVDMEP